MTLYDLLSKCLTNVKVLITDEGKKFTVYSDSVDALDELIKFKMVRSWELLGGQSMAVTLETIVSG